MQQQSGASVLNSVSSSSAKQTQAKRPSFARCAMRNQTRSQSSSIQKERRSDSRSVLRIFKQPLKQTWGHCDNHSHSLCLSSLDKRRDILQMSSILLLQLSKPKPVYNYF